MRADPPHPMQRYKREMQSTLCVASAPQQSKNVWDITGRKNFEWSGRRHRRRRLIIVERDRARMRIRMKGTLSAVRRLPFEHAMRFANEVEWRRKKQPPWTSGCDGVTGNVFRLAIESSDRALVSQGHLTDRGDGANRMGSTAADRSERAAAGVGTADHPARKGSACTAAQRTSDCRWRIAARRRPVAAGIAAVADRQGCNRSEEVAVRPSDAESCSAGRTGWVSLGDCRPGRCEQHPGARVPRPACAGCPLPSSWPSTL